MKTPKTTTVSKLTVRFDNELKTLLMNDLLTIRRAELMNAIQGNMNTRLKAA